MKQYVVWDAHRARVSTPPLVYSLACKIADTREAKTKRIFIVMEA